MHNDNATVNIVNAIVSDDTDALMSAFNNAIANKVMDSLEVKKVEIASSLFQSDTNDTQE